MGAAGGSLRAAGGRRPGFNLLLPVAGLLVLAAFVAVASVDFDLYTKIIGLWSFHMVDAPFYDMGGPVSWIRCWRQGVDVYASNPCDALDRLMNYSPLLLRLPLPWTSEASVTWYALALDALFLGCLAVLPRPRAGLDGVQMLLAVASPFCVFALERANLDLLVFVLVAVAIVLLGRGPGARLFGYAAIVAAGLLKFYPFVLLLLLVRERRARFLVLGTICAIIFLAFAWRYSAELRFALAHIPRPRYYDDGFGAPQLPFGLVAIEIVLRGHAEHLDSADLAVWVAGTLVCYAAAIVGGLRLGRSATLRDGLALLSERESLCLSAGAMLICACFFIGVSVGYRAVLFLFALSGLLALARVCGDTRFARRLHLLAAGSLVAVWCLPIQRLIAVVFGRFWRPDDIAAHAAGSALPGIAFWLLREAIWWSLVTFLLAVIVQTVLTSRTWTETLATLPRSLRLYAGGR